MFQLHNWRSISRTAKGHDPGPEGSINKLWWWEMSKRLHDTAMAVLGDARRCGGAPTRTRATVRGSVVALLPGELDLGRAPTRSSATSSANARSASPANPVERSDD